MLLSLYFLFLMHAPCNFVKKGAIQIKFIIIIIIIATSTSKLDGHCFFYFCLHQWASFTTKKFLLKSHLCSFHEDCDIHQRS